MKVFISWSGDLSRQLGEALRNWLPSALQHVKPYFTPDDIDKGAKWASEISKELSASSVCIIILTRDNLTSSWIMFEAGAISSTIDNAHVCPIVFDLEPTDLQGPLAQFQVTRFVKADVRKLFNTINLLAGENKLPEAVADTVFEKWWPDLEKSLKAILDGHSANSNVKKIRSDRALIEEILTLLRANEKGSSRPAPPYPAPPYEGSPTEQFINIVKFVIDEDGRFSIGAIHPMLEQLRIVSFRRMAEGPSKIAFIEKLEELIERTKPQRRGKPAARPDDDVPL